MVYTDIMRGSSAWERVRNGVPREISDAAVRTMFHDYASLLTVMVANINQVMDEYERMGARVDLGVQEHEKLTTNLFDAREGLFHLLREELKNYTDAKVTTLTKMGYTVGGGLVTASLLLAANITFA